MTAVAMTMVVVPMAPTVIPMAPAAMTVVTAPTAAVAVIIMASPAILHRDNPGLGRLTDEN